MTELSVIIPVFNESESIALFVEEVSKAINAIFDTDQYEIIIVDDGSTDKTGAILAQIDVATVLTFRRNQGQSAAMKAGLDHSSGRLIAFLDGDGQNDPTDIPSLIDELNLTGNDLICGWRIRRQDPIIKKIVSKGAYKLRQLLIQDGVHDSGCTLKVGKRDALMSIQLHGELHRLIPAQTMLSGFKVSEVRVNHRPRQFGKTKYTYSRIIKGFIDIAHTWFWKKYESRPLHFFGIVGGSLIVIGLASGISAVVMNVIGLQLWRYSLPILTILLILTGTQIVLTGLIADRLFRIQYLVSKQPRYAISKIKPAVTSEQ